MNKLAAAYLVVLEHPEEYLSGLEKTALEVPDKLRAVLEFLSSAKQRAGSFFRGAADAGKDVGGVMSVNTSKNVADLTNELKAQAQGIRGDLNSQISGLRSDITGGLGRAGRSIGLGLGVAGGAVGAASLADRIAARVMQAKQMEAAAQNAQALNRNILIGSGAVGGGVLGSAALTQNARKD